MAAKSWNYRIEPRVSFVTGKATEPANPCVKCKQEATAWVAHDYFSGRAGRTATTYRAYCSACAERVVAEKNTPEETENVITARKNARKTAETPVEVPPAEKPKRGRKPKGDTKETQEQPTAAPAIITEEEAAIVEKYNHLNVVPGSWRASGERPEFGHKRTVQVTCKTCETVRTICTSDAQWPTCAFCVTCAADVKRSRRYAKKAKAVLK